MEKAYKLFRKKGNKLYPLFVLATKEIPMHTWIPAESGVLTTSGKVKSKLGNLCYRPGWHLNDLCPYVQHIGIKGPSGKIEYMNPDYVWCEVSYSDTINYQKKADEKGKNKNGQIIKRNAYLKEIPVNGFYRYKTNPQMFGEWIIAGAIRIERILSDEEVVELCKPYGLVPMPRYKKVN